MVPQCWGLGSPKPQRRTYPAALPSPGAAKDSAGHSGREKGQGPPSPRRPLRPSHEKASAHAPARQRPHLSPPLCSPQSQWIGPPGLLGDKPHPRSAPMGPLPRGLAPQRRDWGPQSPSQDSACRPAATRAARGAAVHSVWENRQGPPNPRRHSKALRSKMLAPTVPLASALTSARRSAHHIADVSGLPAS